MLTAQNWSELPILKVEVRICWYCGCEAWGKEIIDVYKYFLLFLGQGFTYFIVLFKEPDLGCIFEACLQCSLSLTFAFRFLNSSLLLFCSFCCFYPVSWVQSLIHLYVVVFNNIHFKTAKFSSNTTLIFPMGPRRWSIGNNWDLRRCWEETGAWAAGQPEELPGHRVELRKDRRYWHCMGRQKNEAHWVV